MGAPPCARCSRLGIECTVDPHFRRSNQRDRVRQLESNIRELRQSLSNADAGDPDAGTKPTPVEPIGSRAVAPEPALVNQLVNQETIQNEGNVCTYSIGSVTLSSLEAEQLHIIFFRDYHPLLPFLDETVYAGDRYLKCPLLFWAMIAVAARRYGADPTLLSRLTPLIEELLQTALLAGLASVAQVQAVILLGYWPFQNHRFWNDRYLLHCTTAVISSMQLGLHRPGHEHEYSRRKIGSSSESPSERYACWLAAVSLALSSTTDLGLPSTVPIIGEGYNFPWANKLCTNLLQLSTIQRCSHQIVSTLHTLNLDDSTYAQLESLEEEANALAQKLGQDLALTNSLRLLYTKLYVQCMFFLPSVDESFSIDNQEQKQQQQQQRRKEGILRAYNTAVSITTVCISHERALDDLSHAPTQTARMILLAALVIFRVLHSSFHPYVTLQSHPSLIDSEFTTTTITGRGRILCGMACFALQRCSISRGDEKDLPCRMVDLLREMWRAAEGDALLCSQEPFLEVTSRMGAGVIFDSLDIWRRRYKERVGVGAGDNGQTLPLPRCRPASRGDAGVEKDIGHGSSSSSSTQTQTRTQMEGPPSTSPMSPNQDQVLSEINDHEIDPVQHAASDGSMDWWFSDLIWLGSENGGGGSI
ncbi:uncharacterized protein BDV14DRAFT_199196 [Aspergillus stella-maris]|uniref:uncharacterized protein n=1 Tax=Aspergillus stella-maris TaxID=1810926 RepID=UPI003CCD0043